MKKINLILDKLVTLTDSHDEQSLYKLCSDLMCSYACVRTFVACKATLKKNEEFYISTEFNSDKNFELPLESVKTFFSQSDKSANERNELTQLYGHEDIKIFLGYRRAITQTVFLLELSEDNSLYFSSESEKLEHLSAILKLVNNHINVIQASERDVLTGLLNRQAFNKRINPLLLKHNNKRRQVDLENTLCLCVFDLDHFKRINDNYGHLYGDEVLLHFAQLMEQHLRHNDFIFRFGGEEFIVLLQDINEELATKVVERLKVAVEEYHFPGVGQVTVSIGATFVQEHEASDTAIERADRALYYVKGNGRNNFAFYEELLKQGIVEAIHLDEGDMELF